MQTQALDETGLPDAGGPVHLDAGAELTISHVAALQQAWLGQLEAGPAEVRVALAAVEEFDSAGLQLLLALRNYQRTRGQALLVVDPSASIVAALQTFGMTASDLACVAMTEVGDVDA